MKVLIASLIGIIFLVLCPRVKLVDATSQDWFAGRYESGKGTDYVLTLKARGGSDKLVINKLWVGDDYYEVKAIKNLAKKSNHDFDKGDTLFVKVGMKLLPDKEGQMIKVEGEGVKSPKEFTGVALLAYTWKGKQRFLEIKEFQVLEKIIYP